MKGLATYRLLFITCIILLQAHNISAQEESVKIVITSTDATNSSWDNTSDVIIATLIEDSNNYIGTSDSVETDWKSNNIINLYPNEVVTIGDSNLDDGTSSEGLTFTLISSINNCKTSKCTYTIDTINSTADSIIISSLSFDFYDIYYLEDEVCSSVENAQLISEISPTYLNIETDNSNVYFDDANNILTDISETGIHIINFSSDYCLKQYADTINIIPALKTELTFDTLAYCTNTLNERKDNYTILSLNNSKEAYDFSVEQDVLISDLEDNGCLIYDTCFIKLVEPLDISLNIDNNCDSVLVSLPESINNINSLSWSNGKRSESVVIDSSQILTVQITDNYNCLSYDTITIDVLPFEVEMDVTTTDADCWTEGKISIDNISTNYGIDNLSYTLKNKLNKVALADLTDIPEGIYEVEVENEEGCVNTPKEIEVKQKCLEDYPVFTPNMDGQDDEYYIPHEGSVKIYDKNGRLKKTMDTPAYWDGTNENGVKLPMGVYLLVTDTGRSVNITIVK